MSVGPTQQLRPFVSSYADFDMAGWPPGRHRGLPDATLSLVVSVGPPLIVRRAGHADAVAADEGYPKMVDAFWRRIAGSGGRVPVASIAAEIGLGCRRLRQLVRAELGLTPKALARIMRFGRARRCLRSGQTASLAETAMLCGYCDQAHLTNDWKQLADCTPGQWMSEELRFLQDQEPGSSASWGA